MVETRQRIATPRAVLEVEILSPRLLTTTMSGHLETAVAQQFMTAVDGWIAMGGNDVFTFHDWERVEDYDSQSRLMLTPWSKAHRSKFAGIHLLVRSRALALGLKIVNEITGGVIKTYSDRRAFMADFQAARSRLV